VIHFGVTSLSTLKIFNVSIPDNFLNIGLPISLAWFALNYFYYLYAEYTQWKATFISEVDVPEGMTDKSWKNRTLIPEIRTLTKNSISIHAEFSTGKGYSAEKVLTPEEVTEDTKELLVNIENQLMSAIKTDVARINEFQSAIKKYNIANQLRFYVLDNAVPIMAVLVAFGVAYNK
jgi:hypothetical protein